MPRQIRAIIAYAKLPINLCLPVDAIQIAISAKKSWTGFSGGKERECCKDEGYNCGKAPCIAVEVKRGMYRLKVIFAFGIGSSVGN